MNKCMDCGARWGDTIFLWLGDDLWEKIGCKPKDFLCAHCIVDRLAKVTTYAYAVNGRQGTSIIGPARLTITTQALV
jgi:hypothetical protein